MLYSKRAPKESIVVKGARVLDPGAGIDEVLDVRVDDGVIAEVGTVLHPNGHRIVEGGGLLLAPAFVDPHVHLRTPGREDEETIESGTKAAAAGGYCAIFAMPNTEPVVDSAAVLGALVETAQKEAEIPLGFLAAITKGQQGGELTEMAELADAGAAAFTDDGMPVAVARPDAARTPVQRRFQPPARAPLRGADAFQGRPDARGRGLRRARLCRLPVGRRERDGRA